MEEQEKIKIGNQNIDFDALKALDNEEMTKILESIFFDGYKEALKTVDSKISEDIKALIERKAAETKLEKKETAVEENRETNETIAITEPTAEVQTEGKIEINIDTVLNSQDPLEQRMKEISEMVYKFKTPGFVLYRLNGMEEEYLKGKYNFTTLPMKALIFGTEQDALDHKEMYWGSAEEIRVKKV